ncbi:hypothetical protein [Caldimonas brevitalea]|uniref:Uncharacterized protein n=1 Tax=Caldimonas brevitalea TaxID=413882 RepID=A0A0G3BPT5_9BURK|nr:hypothetical protein [Caldimonas brevitalea]AKJ31422.1 hypothetical protein AAW51_4731 [Caldimonas brevitalea]
MTPFDDASPAALRARRRHQREHAKARLAALAADKRVLASGFALALMLLLTYHQVLSAAVQRAEQARSHIGLQMEVSAACQGATARETCSTDADAAVPEAQTPANATLAAAFER